MQFTFKAMMKHWSRDLVERVENFVRLRTSGQLRLVHVAFWLLFFPAKKHSTASASGVFYPELWPVWNTETETPMISRGGSGQWLAEPGLGGALCWGACGFCSLAFGKWGTWPKSFWLALSDIERYHLQALSFRWSWVIVQKSSGKCVDWSDGSTAILEPSTPAFRWNPAANCMSCEHRQASKFDLLAVK